MIGTDTFDGSLSQWSTTGTPSTSGGKLNMTAGDRAIFTPTPANANDAVHVETDPLTASATAKYRRFAAWSDSNNFLFGEWSKAAGAATIRLGQKVGGTESWLTSAKTVEDTGTELDARSTTKLCWEPGEVQEGEAGEIGHAATVVAEGGGDIAWTNISDALADDGAEALASSFTASGQTSKELAFTGFPFAIPPGSTIDGITVTVKCRDNNNTPAELDNTLLKLYDGGGNLVGDNKQQGIIPGVAGGSISAGGIADDWNAGLTWEDINSGQFGVVVQFTARATVALAECAVDTMGISINYTTPDRRPGKLTFTYYNTGSATVDCVRDFSVFSPADGLKTGIEVVTGTFDFQDFTYSYLFDATIRPDCPNCECSNPAGCSACDGGLLPLQVQVDLSGIVGGSECANCETDFNATFVLDFNGMFTLAGTTYCEYIYYFDEPKCVSTQPGGLIPNYAHYLVIQFTLLDGLGDDYALHFQVIGGASSDPDDANTAIAWWRKGMGATAIDCLNLTDEDLGTIRAGGTTDCNFTSGTVLVTSL